MTTTTNYNLKKPAPEEFYTVADFNANADTIDAELKEAEDHRSAANPHSGSEGLLKDAAAKETPADADSVALVDSADGSKTKRVLWSRIKAVLGDVFAALSHTHAAGDITSGTLGLARGGTGAATAAAARTNLGAGAASGLATLDGSAKVAAAQASARIISKTASATLALAEAGCFIYFNNGTTACTLTVPANSSVAFPVGTEIEVLRGGTGTITIAAASGVTIYSVDSAKKIDSQFGVVCLKKTGTDTWVLAGCLG